MVAPSRNFYSKIWVGFCLNSGKRLILEVSFKAWILLNNGTRDFQTSHSFERSACFYVQPLEILNDFTTLMLTQIIWKEKTFFKKLEYHFLVESTKIESAIFPQKLSYQKPMLREIESKVQNGPITNNRILPITALFFLEILFQYGIVH